MSKPGKILVSIVLIIPVVLAIINYFHCDCAIYKMNPYLYITSIFIYFFTYIAFLYRAVEKQKKISKKILVSGLVALIFCAGAWFFAFADAFINYFLATSFSRDWSLFLYCLKLGFSNSNIYFLDFPTLVIGAFVISFLAVVLTIDVISEKIDNFSSNIYDFFSGEDEDTPLTLEEAVEDSMICRKNLQDIIKEMPKTEESKCKIFKLAKENDDINLCFYLAFYFHEFLTKEEYKEIVEIMNNCSDAELYNQFNKVSKRIETEQATAE